MRFFQVVVAAVLLAAVPRQLLAQATSGTTPTGLYYEVSGSGEPIVFVHAFSVDRRMWEPQITAFEKRFRVVRYDLRGHGKSAPTGEPYTGYDDLLSLLDTLKIERATLVGLSAGSELAINFAIAHPTRVNRLVLAAPGLGGYAVPPLPWMMPVFEAAGKGDAQRAATLWAETPIMAMKTNRRASATVTALVMDNVKLWTSKRSERPLTPPAIKRLSEVKAPTLVIVGDQDLPHIIDVANLLAKEIAGARLLTIKGAGHIVNLDTPREFNDAVATFLK